MKMERDVNLDGLLALWWLLSMFELVWMVLPKRVIAGGRRRCRGRRQKVGEKLEKVARNVTRNTQRTKRRSTKAF
jgi:hypothetical protein